MWTSSCGGLPAMIVAALEAEVEAMSLARTESGA
jgi:hypothetical protein